MKLLLNMNVRGDYCPVESFDELVREKYEVSFWMIQAGTFYNFPWVDQNDKKLFGKKTGKN